MIAFVFVVTAIWTLFVVALRRLFRGPLHPGWTYRYEALAEILRDTNRRHLDMPIPAMRKALAGMRIHPKIYAVVKHGRTTLAGIPTETFTPIGWKESDPTLLYYHGGGYIVCSPATHRDLLARIAVAAGARTLAIDYRKAPEHPYPGAVDDGEAAYRAVLESGTPAKTLFVGGDSAGGGLALAVLIRLRDGGLPLPRAAVLLSPWVDLECTGKSIADNAAYDYLPAHGLLWGANQYLQGADARNPHASPVHADLRGLPPLLIQTGGVELFLSENSVLAEKARAAGVDVVHEVEPGMVHVFQALASFAPAECEPAIERIGAFVRERHGVAEKSAGAEAAVEAAGVAPAEHELRVVSDAT